MTRPDHWSPPNAQPIPDNFRDLVAAAKELPANDPPPERDAEPGGAAGRREGAGVSTRKKWRLKLIPTFTYETCRSQKHAYERMFVFRQQYADGLTRIHHVNIEVDEGSGWVLFERCVFPQRGAQ